MARAVPQIVRILDTRSYEREVLGSEPVIEQREPRLVDTKIDVNFYLTEKEAQYLYAALEVGIQGMAQETRNYGSHPAINVPGREPICSTNDWDASYATSKTLANILHDALITAVAHRMEYEEPDMNVEPEPRPEKPLSELSMRLLEFYAKPRDGGYDNRTFLIKEATAGRTFIEDDVEAAEAELESRELVRWTVVSTTPEGLVLQVTDAGRMFLQESKANTVKPCDVKPARYSYNHTQYCNVKANEHTQHCEAVKKCDENACTCAEAFGTDNIPSSIHAKWRKGVLDERTRDLPTTPYSKQVVLKPEDQPEAGNALHQKLCDEGFSGTQE